MKKNASQKRYFKINYNKEIILQPVRMICCKYIRMKLNIYIKNILWFTIAQTVKINYKH
jgi:hypothetical protein